MARCLARPAPPPQYTSLCTFHKKKPSESIHFKSIFITHRGQLRSDALPLKFKQMEKTWDLYSTYLVGFFVVDFFKK